MNLDYIHAKYSLLGSKRELEYVIGVKAQQEISLQRKMDSENLNEEKVRDRMRKKMDEETKMRLCDYVIVNDEHQLLIPHVLKLH